MFKGEKSCITQRNKKSKEGEEWGGRSGGGGVGGGEGGMEKRNGGGGEHSPGIVTLEFQLRETSAKKEKERVGGGGEEKIKEKGVDSRGIKQLIFRGANFRGIGSLSPEFSYTC